MAKSLIRQVFGIPSTEVLQHIGSSDKVSRLQEALYAYTAKRRELERQFEAKACELRQSYLAEVADIDGEEEAA